MGDSIARRIIGATREWVAPILIAHAKAPKRYPPALIQLLLRGCLMQGLDQLDKQHRDTVYYTYEKLQCESITTAYSYKLLRQ